jgi:hypothetical protein
VATASLFTFPVALDAASELAREIDKLSWTIYPRSNERLIYSQLHILVQDASKPLEVLLHAPKVDFFGTWN